VRLLVAEDEPRMAELLRRGLREEGYLVDIATSGTDALWLGKEVDYDAIVLDVMLPGLDGFEVCRQFRQHDRWAPVIMLTARGDVADRVRGLDAGADDYLAKPFSLVELSARLRALIRRGAVARPVMLRVGALRLDPATRQVWRADQPVSLSATEFALLELFMRHPGQVLTRSRILGHVWDFGYDAASNVVDQYVGYLRRKIDRPFGRADLETVRGAGYRLRPEAEQEAAGVQEGARRGARARDEVDARE
jgi:two-component system OmpR family response regulator